MITNGFTHVSVHAHDLKESARFYRDLFGMEELPSPDFPSPVHWLKVGTLQLHLFQSEETAHTGHHFGLDVEDFEAVYLRAKEIGAQVEEGYFSRSTSFPMARCSSTYATRPATWSRSTTRMLQVSTARWSARLI